MYCFVVKQMTAYEMRISDWSSDVCSSDLTLSCGSIEHKMGIHANATCVMNYDGATGWLVGDENKGLAAMFVMMNAARLGVGIQGLGQADIAWQNAVQYAQDRRQGRALTGPADPQDRKSVV